MAKTLEERASSAVSRELAKTPPHERADMMRSLARHAIAGLQVLEGPRRAAEHAYVIGDQTVGSRGRDPQA